MDINKKPKISLFRLRLGVFLIFIWWIPIYLAIPALVASLNLNSSNAQTIITISVIVIQTILGIIGFVVVGKSVASSIKEVKFKYVPNVFWHMIWNGDINIPTEHLKPKKPSNNLKQPIKN